MHEVSPVGSFFLSSGKTAVVKCSDGKWRSLGMAPIDTPGVSDEVRIAMLQVRLKRELVKLGHKLGLYSGSALKSAIRRNHQKNRERNIAYSASYHKAHRDEILRRYHESEELIQRRKEYYQKNCDKIKERANRSYLKHKDEKLQYCKRYYKEHLEEKREYRKQYYQKHRDEIVERQRKARAKKAQLAQGEK